MKKIRLQEGEMDKDKSSKRIRNCSKLLENFKMLVQITNRWGEVGDNLFCLGLFVWLLGLGVLLTSGRKQVQLYLQRVQGYHDCVWVTPSLQRQPLGYNIYAASPDLCDVCGIRERSLLQPTPLPLAFSALWPGPIHNIVLANCTPGLGLKLKRSTEN